jgi:nitroreductase
MDFGDIARQRAMVRSYTKEPVDSGAIERIVDAAIRAPSAGFSQGQRFVVVTDAKARSAVAAAGGENAYLDRGFDPWLSAAPVHIVICVDRQAYVDRYAESDKTGIDEWTVPYWWVDAGASLMAILYAAVNEGLAAGFLGAHAFTDLGMTLGIPSNVLITGVVTIGHGAADRGSASVAKGRRERTEMVRWQHW